MARHSENDSRELGKWLFSVGPGANKTYFYCGLVGAVLSLMAAGAVAIAMNGHPQMLFVMFLPAFTLVPCLLVMLILIRKASNIVRVFQQGIRQSNWLGSSELLFEDVDSFTFRAIEHYVYGVYRSTVFNLRFRSDRDGQRRQIDLMKAAKGTDARLEQLRDAVSHAMAPRLFDELDAEGELRWTPKLTLSHEGVGYKRGAIPFSEIDGIQFVEGHFELFVRGDHKPFFSAPASTENFFPVLVVFESLMGNEPDADDDLVEIPSAATEAVAVSADAIDDFDTYGSDIESPQDEFTGCRACGRFMIGLLATATIILFVGCTALIAWQFSIRQDLGMDAVMVSFFPIVGTLLAMIVAIYVHRCERRRVATWRASPQSVESTDGDRPRPGVWMFWQLFEPIVVLLLIAVVPQVIILWEFFWI